MNQKKVEVRLSDILAMADPEDAFIDYAIYTFPPMASSGRKCAENGLSIAVGGSLIKRVSPGCGGRAYARGAASRFVDL
jgi:hypothetical protein